MPQGFTAYHTVIDTVDEGKELTFALIQDHCARENRRTTRDPDRHGPARGDDRCRPWNRRDLIPADDPGWDRCTVKKHEDFPRHIFRLFLLLVIQFRWLLTRGTLGRALVTDAEAAIDDAKERAWMDL